MSGRKKIYLAVGVAFLALLIRIPGAGTFATVDEESWTIRAADFYHQLILEKNPGGTFVTTHPGATAMWVIGAGVAVREMRVGFNADTSNMATFRKAAVWPVLLVNSALIGLIAWILIRLMGASVGAAAGGLLAVEPYLVGMSQVAHLDMLLALLMLVSVLAYITFIRKRKWKWLVAAGVFAGLAMGVKLLPAIWLFIFFAGFIKIKLWRKLFPPQQ